MYTHSQGHRNGTSSILISPLTYFLLRPSRYFSYQQSCESGETDPIVRSSLGRVESLQPRGGSSPRYATSSSSLTVFRYTMVWAAFTIRHHALSLSVFPFLPQCEAKMRPSPQVSPLGSPASYVRSRTFSESTCTARVCDGTRGTFPVSGYV